jgi:hypothetical protein
MPDLRLSSRQFSMLPRKRLVHVPRMRPTDINGHLTRGRQLYSCPRWDGLPGRLHKLDGATARDPVSNPRSSATPAVLGSVALPFTSRGRRQRQTWLAPDRTVQVRRCERPSGARLNQYHRLGKYAPTERGIKGAVPQAAPYCCPNANPPARRAEPGNL